ncbi:MAG: hypothetical protein LBE24_09605 [Methylobacillus sp.]|jgi:hypothetical protein|nr:hypothetical protein [Methylobacillus sp.]
MNITRCLLLFSALAVWLPLCAMAAPTTGDAWEGRYRLTWGKDTGGAKAGASGIVIAIERAPNANPAGMDEESRADLARWTLSIYDNKNLDDKNINKISVDELRRFLSDEYAGIQAKGGIECLQGGVGYFCRVKPGTTVDYVFYKGKVQARTGFFGLFDAPENMEGDVELTPLDPKPYAPIKTCYSWGSAYKQTSCAP